MEWLNKIKEIMPNLKVERKRIEKRVRIDIAKLKECEVGVVRRERPFWREDKIDLVHKEPGRQITYTPLK